MGQYDFLQPIWVGYIQGVVYEILWWLFCARTGEDAVNFCYRRVDQKNSCFRAFGVVQKLVSAGKSMKL